ncbi:glucosaminidase domain-containing protein [Hyphomicrobium sp.]|uniref:glucosaminidase domain-containing protein n=1 Tax=Hyphomicrobium sp. TaxID=82 RepID=UPI003F715D08
MIALFSGLSRVRPSRRLPFAAGLLAALAGSGGALAAGELPEIRVSKANPVPACATPDRLMAFLKRRNAALSPRFSKIASFYKTHGERWGVRWDYAFFQMAIETNFLTYRAPNGRMGDVDPKQNNFAGIGTTGGGVPGDSFPDVSTGVLGQIQHLVAYSGEEVPNPVAQRTQLKQVHILEKSRELRRPVRFSDLAKRWAVDPKYGNSIEWVAQKFRAEFCPSGGGGKRQEVEVLPWQRTSDAQPISPQEAGSPVRTVWRQDQAQASADAMPAPKRKTIATVSAQADAKDVGTPAAAAAEAAAAPDADAPSAPEIVADAAPALAAGAAAEEPHFALFTPPTALADASVSAGSTAEAVVAPVTPSKVATVPEPAGPPPPPAATATPTNAGANAAANTGANDVVMGPPPPSNADVQTLATLAPSEEVPPTATVQASKSTFLPPSGLGVKPGRCIVETATFAGDTTVLVKSPVGADVHYIALSVLDGFEESMARSFIDARPQGGEALGVYPSKEAALTHARTLCPQ